MVNGVGLCILELFNAVLLLLSKTKTFSNLNKAGQKILKKIFNKTIMNNITKNVIT